MTIRINSLSQETQEAIRHAQSNDATQGAIGEYKIFEGGVIFTENTQTLIYTSTLNTIHDDGLRRADGGWIDFTNSPTNPPQR